MGYRIPASLLIMFGKYHVMARGAFVSLAGFALVMFLLVPDLNKAVTCKVNTTQGAAEEDMLRVDVHAPLPFYKVVIRDSEKNIKDSSATELEAKITIETDFADQKISNFLNDVSLIDTDEFGFGGSTDMKYAIGRQNITGCEHTLNTIKTSFWMYWSLWFLIIAAMIVVKLLTAVNGSKESGESVLGEGAVNLCMAIYDLTIIVSSFLTLVVATFYEVRRSESDDVKSLFNDKCILGRELYPTAYDQADALGDYTGVKCESETTPYAWLLTFSIFTMLIGLYIAVLHVIRLISPASYDKFGGSPSSVSAFGHAMNSMSTSYAMMFEN